MTFIRHQIRADCAPERVWAILADLEAVQRYKYRVKLGPIGWLSPPQHTDAHEAGTRVDELELGATTRARVS